MVAAQLVLTAVKARNLVVQSEADSVENAGFTSPGLARDEKDTVTIEAFEVNDLLFFVRAESGEPQAQDFHEFAARVDCSVNSSATSALSKSVGPTPLRTNARNPATISGSLVAAPMRSV